MNTFRRERLIKMGQHFQGETDCFIHVEMKDGKNCECAVAGGGMAVLHGVGAVINYVAMVSGQSVADTWEAARTISILAETEQEG